jgi:hydroxymethylglutaryl-CoA reductase
MNRKNEMFDKFYNKTIKERQEILKDLFNLNVENDLNKRLSIEEADKIVENVIAIGCLPIGLLTNLKLNNKHYVVPMMIEEPSVIAAANKACKLSLPKGFKGQALGNEMLGIVQIKTDNLKRTAEKIKENENEINRFGKEVCKNLEKYNGGWRSFYIEELKTKRGNFILFKFLVNTADAMGANIINSTAESLGIYLEQLLKEKVILRILSNYAVKRKVKLEAVFSINKEERELFLDAFEIAKHDIYRLVTNNKGFLNGADAVCLAFGQDFRAVEASLHSYSIENKKPLVNFTEHEDGIKAYAELPIAVGITGGAINVLPHAQTSLKITKPKTASELAMIIGCVGIANNFAATYALATKGIQQGHMKLHSRIIALSLGAKEEEIEIIQKLVENGIIKPKKDEIEKALAEIRKRQKN